MMWHGIPAHNVYFAYRSMMFRGKILLRRSDGALLRPHILVLTFNNPFPIFLRVVIWAYKKGSTQDS